MELSSSNMGLVDFDPREKCRRKGLVSEFFTLELEPNTGLFTSCLLLLRRSGTLRSESRLLSMIRFLDFLLFVLYCVSNFTVLPGIFRACLSPAVQIGQGGSNLEVSGVVFSKHSAWNTCPQTRTATTESSLLKVNFWVTQRDFSIKSFKHTPQVLVSVEGVVMVLFLDLITFPREQSKDSVSKDHRSL